MDTVKETFSRAKKGLGELGFRRDCRENEGNVTP